MENSPLQKKELTSLRLEIEKVAGTFQEDLITGAFSKKIALADGSIGTAIAIVLLNKQNGNRLDLPTLLRDIFELLTKKLEGTTESVLEAIQNAVEAVLAYTKDSPLELNFSLAFFWNDVCYLACHGEKVNFLVFDGLKFGEIHLKAGSGPVHEGQIYAIATEDFLANFDLSQIFSLPDVNLGEVVDGIATEISAKKNQSRMAAVFVKIKGEDNQEGKERTEDGEVVEEVESEGDHEGPKPFPIWRVIFQKIKLPQKEKVKTILSQRKNLATGAFVVLLILAVSVGLTLRKKSEQQKLAQFNQHYSTASSHYEQGVAVLELNKQRARQILIEADKEIKLALEIFPKDEAAQKVADEIANKLKESAVTANVNFSILAEVDDSLISLSFADKNLMAISSGKIFEISLGDKSVRENDGPEGAKSGFVFDDKAFILTGEVVFKVDLARRQSAEIFKTGKAQDLFVFLGNVYLLQEKGIDKFVPIEKGYSGPSAYLNNPTNFGSRSRLAIDGSVWVTVGSQIFKFMRGVNENFAISGLTGGIGEFGAIYTTASLDNLYVVDVTNSALLVIGKDGVYKRAYQSPEFGRATDIIIDETESKIYLAVANKILEAALE